MNLAKLKLLKVILSVLQGITLIAIFFFAIIYYSNLNVIRLSNDFIPRKLVIDSMSTGSVSSSNLQSVWAHGFIDSEQKSLPLDRTNSERNESIGDTLYVWNITGRKSLIKRSKNEKVFSASNYEKDNLLIIIFVFIPTIIIWVSRFMISKRIKILKEL